MARHPRPHARIKTRPRRRVLKAVARLTPWWILRLAARLRLGLRRTAYHRTHPWFMAYTYCSALAALLVVSWVARGIS